MNCSNYVYKCINIDDRICWPPDGSTDGAEMKMERVYYTERLLDAFRRYYDVNQEVEGAPEEFFARCDFHVTDARYVLSKKNVLWSTDSHEYCYIFSLDHLTLDDYRRFEKYAYDDGMKRITPGHGHKCTAITLIAVCKSCESDARRALRRCRLHKEFRFSLDGWMDFHTALAELDPERVYTNFSGHKNAGVLKKLFKIKPEGEMTNEHSIDTANRNCCIGLRLSFLRPLARKNLGHRSDP